MPSRFTSDDDLEQIDLGDGEWVKIPVSIPFGTLEKIAELPGSNAAKTVPTLLLVIRGWNIKDVAGAVPQVTTESIRKLDMATIKAITDRVAAKIAPDEKKG